MTCRNNIESRERGTSSRKSAKLRWRDFINHPRMMIVVSGLVMALTIAPSHACQAPPNSLSDLRNLLVITEANKISGFSLDNENFTAPPLSLHFSTIDAATGNFTGQLAFSPSKTYPISGKLTGTGGSNFTIIYSFRQSIGPLRATDPTVLYTGAIRAFVDPSCNVRYHIAGTFTVTNPLSIVSPKIGPVPFSGTGFTVYFG